MKPIVKVKAMHCLSQTQTTLSGSPDLKVVALIVYICSSPVNSHIVGLMAVLDFTNVSYKTI